MKPLTAFLFLTTFIFLAISYYNLLDFIFYDLEPIGPTQYQHIQELIKENNEQFVIDWQKNTQYPIRQMRYNNLINLLNKNHLNNINNNPFYQKIEIKYSAINFQNSISRFILFIALSIVMILVILINLEKLEEQ